MRQTSIKRRDRSYILDIYLSQRVIRIQSELVHQQKPKRRSTATGREMREHDTGTAQTSQTAIAGDMADCTTQIAATKQQTDGPKAGTWTRVSCRGGEAEWRHRRHSGDT